MIIPRKYLDSFEEYAQSQKHRYSRKAEYYCYLRTNRSTNKRHKLFWINMHLLYGLMKDIKT